MRRSARILLTAATILSTPLACASAVPWARSHRRHDSFGRRRAAAPGEPQWSFGVLSAGGGAAVFATRWPPPHFPVPLPGGWYRHSYDDTPVDYAGGSPSNRRGFGLVWEEDPSTRRCAIVFPLWLPTALFAALPLARGAIFIRRRRRKVEGRCAKCGYDLRATPDRCPECGHVPARVRRAGVA